MQLQSHILAQLISHQLLEEDSVLKEKLFMHKFMQPKHNVDVDRGPVSARQQTSG